MEENTTKTILRTNRSMWKFVLLSLVTLGIYSIVCLSHVSTEINKVAGPYDQKKTMHYCLVFFIFSWLTLGIFPLIWWSMLCSRMGKELTRRGIDYKFGAGTYWGWGFFGTLIVVGPFVFYHKFFKAMNQLNADYNERG
ncbi:MAG: DUF4234 domain-containing protein [Bacteroidales bacterium]|jgi:hypothetical protein|nr:DUF4234 domain-containing protein [Bacteroidales bacterium]